MVTGKNLNIPAPEILVIEVSDICRQVGRYIDGQRSAELELEKKGKHNFVTEVDKTAEKMLVARLKELLPQAGVLAEEGMANDSSGEMRWIIDPLDGTTNFIHGIPFFSVSVALESPSGLLAGVVYDVVNDECFTAWQDGPAKLNGEEISVSQTMELGNSLVATGFPYEHEQGIDTYLALFGDVVNKSRGLRRLGSAALDLAYVACGRFSGFYELGLNPWDIAAGVLLVRQAGGKVTSFDGTHHDLPEKDILATNGVIHEELLKLTRKHYGPK